MSWLNIAKNALKEAQQKIDKVLDIQNEEDEVMENDNHQFMAETVEPISSKSLKSLDDKENVEEEKVEAEECNTTPTENLQIESDPNFSLNDSTNTLNMSMLADFVQIPESIIDKNLTSEEVETATSSSDIEIISNPNGDTSSTNSICHGGSPVVKSQCNINNSKKRHCREPSEISIQSEDSQSETDKLMRRISELNEILESREMRLLEVSRQNAALIEKTAEYTKELEAKQKKKEFLETEETQRLSSLEKKYQIIIRERDTLHEQLNSVLSKIPKDDMCKIINEKDQMIDELQIEGEKLSKQILQHSDIIKKLRSKERDNLNYLKKNKEQIESLTDELDRLKKSLTAKEEIERAQIDAVHKLSSIKNNLEKENSMLKSQIEDHDSKLETLQKSFDAVKNELREKQQTHLELTRKAQIADSWESEKKHTQNQNQEIMLQLEQLRHGIKSNDTDCSLREQKLRQENSDLLKRLELAELRCEKLTSELSNATIPLVLQLEALQKTLTSRTNSWEVQEEEYLLKIRNSKEELEKIKHAEQESLEQRKLLSLQVKSLEDHLKMLAMKSEEENSFMQEKEFKFNMDVSEYKKKIFDYESKINEYVKLVNDLKNRQQIDRSNTNVDDNDQRQQISSNDHSPPISIGQNSLSESLHSAGWQMEDLEVLSNSGRREFGSVSFNMGQSAAIYENLQSSVKQKDGEISQMQWELSRLQSERNFLNNEVSRLTLEMLELKELLQTKTDTERELDELRNQYDALLEMYGEKVEETQELKLDLQDIKILYKGQIDELLKQTKSEK